MVVTFIALRSAAVRLPGLSTRPFTTMVPLADPAEAAVVSVAPEAVVGVAAVVAARPLRSW